MPFLRFRWPFWRRKSAIPNNLLKEADAARDARDFARAAALYGDVLRHNAERGDIRIQRAHMRKEAGNLVDAEQDYLLAVETRGDDADLALQLGHFYKVADRNDEAERWYRRAHTLEPANPHAEQELRALALRKPLPLPASLTDSDLMGLTITIDSDFALPFEPPSQDGHVEINRLGRLESGRWGVRRTLRGVEAIRGYRLSAASPEEVEIAFGPNMIHREALTRGNHPHLCKLVFNAWIDTGRLAPGLYRLELRFLDGGRPVGVWNEDVVVAQPSCEEDAPDLDAIVSVDPSDDRPIEEQVRARASMIRSPPPPLFLDDLRNLLVLRTDQLGDLVASIPAIQRLREIAPKARFVGLLTDANAPLARTLNLFDEIIVIDFPDDPSTRRRLMSLSEQAALRARLKPYEFDVAIDLAASNVSRPLLSLSGARFRFGFGGTELTYSDGTADIRTADSRTGMDRRPHSAKVLAMAEALNGLLASKTPTIRRHDLSRAQLEPYGIAPDQPFAVLHTGARIAFSRWPHFAQLAEQLLVETDLSIVMIAPDGDAAPPDRLLAFPRFVWVDRQMPFDDLDALLSFAKVMIGNDSGPKHLASLRGTPVVTLFSARIGWAEWAQGHGGSIISRRVPCAGCAIFHDTDECGKAFACIKDIRIDEVAAAVSALL